MTEPRWELRPATASDRDFLFELHRATMRPYVEPIFGWNDTKQAELFDEAFTPANCQVIQIGGEDAGVLEVAETAEEIWLTLIELDPRWQGAGVGTSVVSSVLHRGAETRRPVGLRVLRTNSAARALYERLGFVAFCETDERIYLRADPPA
ncbi:MAG: GNAT family N-acetyltransferase [Gaiellaceae bacterium]